MTRESSMAVTLLALCLVCSPVAHAQEESPAWAYPVNPPDFKLPADDGTLRSVPGSGEHYSTPQVRDRFLAPDWHPADHPPMPTIVAAGRKPDVSACGFCHRAEGTGGPENASLAGLPVAYMLQQMADYKSGARSTAVPKRAPHTLMIAGAKAIADDEAQSAAVYFSGLKPRKNIRVVETEEVPKTFVAGWFLAKQEAGGWEPVGQRIIETPDRLEHFDSRDSRATFTAYVPPMSLKRGQTLVSGQDLGKTLACATCHGKDLRGVDAVPSIAGRSPTYVFRQLHEMKIGLRAGASALPMQGIVAKLSHDDMIAIAAYLGSLEP
jgi:cytochrome c553